MLSERVEEWTRPWREQGREEGRKQGREEGREAGRREGRKEGELLLLRRLVEKRFGPLPAWAAQQLEQASECEVELWAERVPEVDILEAPPSSRAPEDVLPDLEDIRAMLSERAEEWTRAWREQGREEGREQGRQEGREQGREEGRKEGELLLLRRLMEKRFGPLPAWAAQRLEQASECEVELWAERVLDVDTLEALFAEP